jgi:hypothetical protein
MDLKKIFKKYATEIVIIGSVIQIIFTVVWWFLTSGLADLKNELTTSIREIRTHTQKLSKNLDAPLSGGMTITVGVNPREITENLIVVHSNNKYGLKAGDSIVLTNFTDNTFKSSLNFVVHKSIEKPMTDKSNAEIFISEAAAKRIGFDNFRRVGLIELKMTRNTSVQ